MTNATETERILEDHEVRIDELESSIDQIAKTLEKASKVLLEASWLLTRDPEAQDHASGRCAK